MENLQQHKNKVEVAQREAREALAWLQFLTQRREVVNCESNRRIASEYHNGSEITLQSLLDSLNSPQFRAMLALQTPADERAASLKIIQKITGTAETPLTKWTPTETLVKKAKELEERRELSKKSPEELRQIIRDNTPLVGEEDLPAHMTRQYLLSLKGPDFREICGRWSLKKVTERLNQR